MLLFYVRHGDPIYDPDSLTPLGATRLWSIFSRAERTMRKLCCRIRS